jgi:hypothetical protein
MADDYSTLVLDAYKGELFGDGFFGALAPQFDGERREKVELLQRIEQRTAAVLKPLVDPGLLASLDEDETRATGPALADGQKFEWDGFLHGLHDALPAFLDGFVRARELADDPNHPAFAALVAHEETISAFTDLELAGHTSSARALLERYLATAP